MELSKRLEALAKLVTVTSSIADVGTDHGYLPIWLVKERRCVSAIAMDVNVGPLERAKHNIATHQLQSQISTRLSDGLVALAIQEVQGIVIAGMGGGLTIQILSNSFAIVEHLEECILQPQSEIDKVRQYLWENGLRIVQENMIEEDGKYYPMMRVVQGSDAAYSKAELLYGRCLIQDKHPILEKFLRKEIREKEKIISELLPNQHEPARKRLHVIEEEVKRAKEVLERM